MIVLHSSHGEASYDSTTGELILSTLDMPTEHIPTRLDLAEYRRAYKLSERPQALVQGDFDILDWGYWTNTGQYEPACIRCNACKLATPNQELFANEGVCQPCRHARDQRLKEAG